jgi:uncharacterized HhH-GPD family protein
MATKRSSTRAEQGPSEVKPMLRYTDNDEADNFVSKDALALLIGMVLDQQQTIERAFTAPLDLVRRMEREPIVGALNAQGIAEMDLDELIRLFSIVPALHRFPKSMATRTQELCAHIADHYDNEPANLWLTATSGKELLKRMKAVPGFGPRKAQIFTALVGKRLGIDVPGWREAAGEFGEADVLRSVADLDGAESKLKYRELKAAAKETATSTEATNLKDSATKPAAGTTPVRRRRG